MKLLVIDNGNSGNNGVMAMAVALRHNLPLGWELTVCLDNPRNEDKDRRRFLLDGVETKPNLLGFLNAYTAKRGVKLLFPIVALSWLFLQRFTPRLIPVRYVRIRDYDVVVSLCGEDFFSDNWSLHNCIFRLAQCFCALLLQKKLIILAQTFGPFKRRWSRSMARFCTKHATLVTTRDHRSYEELMALVGECPHIMETRDLAFLLKPTDWETATERHPELANLPPRFVAVSVSKTFASNVLRTNGAARAAPERFHDAMAKCLDEFAANTRIPIVFVPQVVVGPSGDDRRDAHEVLKRMNHHNDVSVCGNEYTAGELKAVIGRAYIVVACRMHAQVAAVSQGIPVLALAYSPKSLDVIGRALEYEFVLDARIMEPLNFAKQAAAMMIKLVARREVTRQALLAAMPEIIGQSRSNINLLVAACSQMRNGYPGEVEVSR